MLQQVLPVESVSISRRSMFQIYVSYVSSECCMNIDLVPISMHVHGRATQKRSEGTDGSKRVAASTSLRVYVQHRVGASVGRASAQLQPHAGQARQTATGAA